MRLSVLAIWVLLALALLGCGAGALLGGGRVATLGALARRATATRPRVAAVLLAWMWLGWHVFVR